VAPEAFPKPRVSTQYGRCLYLGCPAGCLVTIVSIYTVYGWSTKRRYSIPIYVCKMAYFTSLLRHTNLLKGFEINYLTSNPLSCQQECQLDTIHQMQCSKIGGLHLGQLFHHSVGYTNLASCWLLPHCHAIPYGAPAGRSSLPMVCCSDGIAGIVVAWSSPYKASLCIHQWHIGWTTN